jgi:glycosyltransferase involved in cell wall biosynthesis
MPDLEMPGEFVMIAPRMTSAVEPLLDPVRVCFATYSFEPHKGGGVVMYYRYLPGFKKCGIRPEIFAGTPKASKIWEDDRAAGWRGLTDGAPLPDATMNGARFHGVRLPDEGRRCRADLFFRALIERCKDPGNRPDVVNLLIKPSAEALLWVRRLRRLGIPLVYSHTIAPPLPNGRLARYVKTQVLRRYFDQMDCVIVQSGFHERWMREIGFRGRIEIIPNGVDTAHFRPPLDGDDRRRLREKLGFSEADRVVVTVGAVTPRKGTDLAIESMRHLVKRVPVARLVVLGWRTDQTDPKLAEFRKKIEELVSSPELATRVHILGVVDNVNEYLRAADAFLFASHREGFPSAIIEAMASDLPAISTRFIGWGAELGEPGRHYLLAEHDPESLAAAVAEVLEKPSVRDRLSCEGARWVQDTMKLDATLDRFATLYRELAGRAPG